MTINLPRRSFLTGLGATLIAAPAIVRAASLMPVRGIVMPVNPATVFVLMPGQTIFFESDGINWHPTLLATGGYNIANGADHALTIRLDAAPIGARRKICWTCSPADPTMNYGTTLPSANRQ